VLSAFNEFHGPIHGHNVIPGYQNLGGSTNFNFHGGPLDIPSVVPQPFSTVPFRRDDDFVDRDDNLARIDEKCSQPAARLALIGLGGVGYVQYHVYAYDFGRCAR
jgi:hypothetical protein